MVLLVTSTERTGLAVTVVEPTWKSLPTANAVPHLPFSTPATAIPRVSVSLLNKPVVLALTRLREGAAAVPSAILAVVFVRVTSPTV